MTAEVAAPTRPAPDEVARARRRLLVDAIGIELGGLAFGVVYGLAAREAGLSLVETSAMSLFAFGGAAQFAAVGLVSQGVPWLIIVGLTALLNARHLLYAAALAPWLAHVRPARRAVMAHFVTDESFALALAHFGRLRFGDERGYWIAGVVTFIAWNLATVAGHVAGQLVPDPRGLGLDIVFPASMAGLAVALVTGRRELVAAVVGASLGVAVAIPLGTTIGVVVGALGGALVALVLPGPRATATPAGAPT